MVTAAHCTSASVTGYTIIAGAIDRTFIEPQQQRWTNLPTSAFVPHPNYGPVLLRNDIAVVRNTATPFVWTNAVQPIQLASDNTERHDGIVATVSGERTSAVVKKVYLILSHFELFKVSDVSVILTNKRHQQFCLHKKLSLQMLHALQDSQD